MTNRGDSRRHHPSSLDVATAVYAATVDRARSKGLGRGLRASARLLFNLKSLFELVGILHEPNTIALARRHPGLIYKYQSHYLARGFGKRQRKAIQKFHYKFVGRAVNSRFYARLVAGNIELWRRAEELGCVTISLRVPEYGREGDLSLVLEIERKQIYELSFTIVPGSVVGVRAPSAMFVARVQGRKGRFDEIKRATKLCCDVSPPYLLMAAAEGLAGALGVTFAVGVGNDDQVSTRKAFDYASFWETLLSGRTGGRFYVLPLPISGVPLEQCSASHRRRTRIKREFKVELSNAVRTAFLHDHRRVQPFGSGIVAEDRKGSLVCDPSPRLAGCIELRAVRPCALSAKSQYGLHTSWFERSD